MLRVSSGSAAGWFRGGTERKGAVMSAQRMLSFAAGLSVAVFASMGSAHAISVDWSSGDPTASNPGPSFIWQGLEFTLNGEPGPSETADHRVTGDSTGQIDFFLKEPGLATYKADLPDFGSAGAINSLSWIYGEDLNSPTSSFSFVQGLFRKLEPTKIGSEREITLGALAGSSPQDSSASPFNGVNGRASNEGGGLTNIAFNDAGDYGAEATLDFTSASNGQVNGTVSVDNTTQPDQSVSFSKNFEPTGDIRPFQFDELLLQVGSFQSTNDFNNQFGRTGQKFSFTGASTKAVPLPTSAWMGLSLLGLIGGAAAWRRFKASQVQA
jgi:hypothetical protein